MNSSKEIILYYWIDIEFEYMILRFDNIEFIDIEYYNLLLNMRYLNDILETNYWDESLNSCEWRDI